MAKKVTTTVHLECDHCGGVSDPMLAVTNIRGKGALPGDWPKHICTESAKALFGKDCLPVEEKPAAKPKRRSKKS